jgi:hypothetical protein
MLKCWWIGAMGLIHLGLLVRPVWGDGAGGKLTLIASGTRLGGERVEGWTDRVLIAVPRVGSGDVEGIAKLVKENAELLSFVVLARVEDRPVEEASSAASGANMKHRAVLADVGVGLAMKVSGQWQVVTGPAAPAGSESARSSVPELGFVGGQVLRTAAESLEDMRLIVRRTTLLIYDSPAVVKIAGQNQEVTVRSMLWIESSSGRLHHALWVMRHGSRQHWMLALEEGVYMKVPMVEDRVLHVQADRFTFGIPSATALGLEALPPGRRFSLAGRLGELACQTVYDEATLGELATTLVAALRKSAATSE